MVPDITQRQVLDLLDPLFEHVGVNPQDVSGVHFTAGSVTIERYTSQGKTSNTIRYTDGGTN